MDRISDADLSWLRGHCTAMGLSAYPERKATWADLVAVIDELRERRAADDARLAKLNKELDAAAGRENH